MKVYDIIKHNKSCVFEQAFIMQSRHLNRAFTPFHKRRIGFILSVESEV